MKTLIGIVALLACSSGCIAEGADVATVEAESVTAAASTDDGAPAEDGADPLELAPAMAPTWGDPSACTSCGPHPQPWHRTLEIHVEAR
jgi:hypothetical protein